MSIETSNTATKGQGLPKGLEKYCNTREEELAASPTCLLLTLADTKHWKK